MLPIYSFMPSISAQITQVKTMEKMIIHNILLYNMLHHREFARQEAIFI